MKDEQKSNLYIRPAQNSYQQIIHVQPASQTELDTILQKIETVRNDASRVEEHKSQLSEKLAMAKLIQSELEGLLEYKQRYLDALEHVLSAPHTSSQDSLSNPFGEDSESKLNASSLQSDLKMYLQRLEERKTMLSSRLSH